MEKNEDWYKSRLISYWVRNKSSIIQKMLMEGTIRRMKHQFDNGKFGIVSGFRFGCTKEEGYKQQFRLCQRIKEMGYAYIAFFGFYSLGHRAVFIPKIEGDKLMQLMEEFELDSYICGDSGRWVLYASDGEAYEFGHNFRVVEPDTDFALYSRIVVKKQQLIEQLNGIRGNHKRLNRHLKDTVAGLKRRLRDLEKVEGELLY